MFDISEYAYKELQYFCMQYREKKKAIEDGYGGQAVRYDNLPHSSGNISDPTYANASRMIKMKEDVEIIERAAKETDRELYRYIIRNVSDWIPFEYLNVPCGRRQFYNKRRLFFYKLYCLKNKNAL